MLDIRGTLAWRHSIMWLGKLDPDLIGAGWVSYLARGNASGIKIAQAESVLR